MAACFRLKDRAVLHDLPDFAEEVKLRRIHSDGQQRSNIDSGKWLSELPYQFESGYGKGLEGSDLRAAERGD